MSSTHIKRQGFGSTSVARKHGLGFIYSVASTIGVDISYTIARILSKAIILALAHKRCSDIIYSVAHIAMLGIRGVIALASATGFTYQTL